MRRWNHDRRFDGIPKIKLQAFEPSSPESLQSQTSLRSKNRLPLNDLGGSSRSTAYFALSPVTTLFDTVACASYRRLDANDWGVRTTRLRRTLQHHSSSALPASTASRPAFVTIAIRPSCRNETVRISELIWVGRKQKYFCRRGLTSFLKIRSDLPVRQNQYLDRSLGQSGKIRFYSRQGDQSERDLMIGLTSPQRRLSHSQGAAALRATARGIQRRDFAYSLNKMRTRGCRVKPIGEILRFVGHQSLRGIP